MEPQSNIQDQVDAGQAHSLLTDERNASLENYGSVEDDSSCILNPPDVTVTNERPGSSWMASVFLVVNAALGAGLLNFPSAYDKSGGLVVAISVQAVLMVFVFVSILILIYCSDINQNSTYQAVVSSLCGKTCEMVCSTATALYCFGTCITFFILIGDQLDKFLMFAYGPDFCLHWYMSRSFTMISTSILFVLPLCFSRRIDFLKYVSFLGVIAVVYCVVLVTLKYFIDDNHPGTIKTKPAHWSDVFVVVPVICFGYQCHLSVVPIYCCMKKRTLPEFTKTVLVALFVCVFAYTGTASFEYLTFGSDVNEDILLSYKPTVDVLIAVFLIAVKMYTTYPILGFVGRSALESVWIEVFKLSPEEIHANERKRRVITVFVWFSASLTFAVFVPGIGIVISFLGALAAVFVFVFPGLCLLQLVLGGFIPGSSLRSFLLISVAAFFLVIGTFMFGIIVTQSAYEITAASPLSGRNVTCIT
ncbi:hypothetical protein CAPTEDRAFT_153758 [Capitella teleta]|uniref:Amino acid transporter transmembrane domain-containing protein n=1 Tax=Capitella teleta TaxID=283909 RepID=R7USP3_CAPTE|nr:hypothetical protein CAPTEDRAFT_153758 [Capitella teleta]|eukprot:ELU06937.1 hypothetical protein CAPTEDRAFT_153758 [Capitella teleta]